MTTPQEAARQIMERILALDWTKDGEAEQAIATIIETQREAATLAERERCAQIVNNAEIPNHASGYMPGWNTELECIAAAIRGQK